MSRAILATISSIILLLAAIMGIGSGRSQARDQHRLTDISQITQALKAFYDANAYYPATADGKPASFTNYLESWPKAPTPPDGICTKENNQYVYEQTNGGASYILSFCLGQNIKGYAPGYYRLKP